MDWLFLAFLGTRDNWLGRQIRGFIAGALILLLLGVAAGSYLQTREAAGDPVTPVPMASQAAVQW